MTDSFELLPKGLFLAKTSRPDHTEHQHRNCAKAEMPPKRKRPMAVRKTQNFNTSYSDEIEFCRRFLPHEFAKNSRRFCEKGRIALRYRPFRSAIWPILEAQMTFLAGRKRPFGG